MTGPAARPPTFLLAAGMIAASALFVAFVWLRDLPSRIAAGRHGRIAIQVLDEVRRPFLEIQGADSALMNEGYGEAVGEALQRGVARGRALIAEFEAAAAYNPELVHRVQKLAPAFEAWVETERALFAAAQGAGPAGDAAQGAAVATASRQFSRIMALLGDAEGPIHDDIERGSEAVSELIGSGAVLIAALLAATFWLMWSRNRALGRLLTELRATDEARRESEERFATLLREVDDVAWAATADGSEMLYMNAACERIYGRPAGDFRARPELWIEAVHPEDRDRVLREAEVLFRQGRAHQEYRIVRPDGEVRWISDRKHLVFDDAGRTIRMGGLATDITERVRAREEREAFVEELESKNAELERYTYTVSHDLKTPLVTINGYLGLIEKDIEQGRFERVPRDFARIKAATATMQQLLRDLLELSRVGHRPRAPEEVSLTQLAREAAGMVAGQLAASSAEVEIDPAMPVVLGDRMRLLEVFQNLLENAVKFSGDQAAPRVEVGMRWQQDEVQFYVRDNGRGIDPRHQERVFGLFEQLGARAEGSGIGLALAKRIVEAHGGRIWVESEGEGHGSTFCFTLPGSPRDRSTTRPG